MSMLIILGITLLLLVLLVLFSFVGTIFNNLGWVILALILWFVWDAINKPRPY